MEIKYFLGFGSANAIWVWSRVFTFLEAKDIH